MVTILIIEIIEGHLINLEAVIPTEELLLLTILKIAKILGVQDLLVDKDHLLDIISKKTEEMFRKEMKDANL